MPPVLAMPPPVYLPYLMAGLAIVAVAATAFVGLTRRRGDERDRRAGLGLLAIVLGPLIGLGLALGVEAAGGVFPLDVVYYRTVYGVIGTIAGLIAGVFFAASAALARNDAKPAKPDPDGLD